MIKQAAVTALAIGGLALAGCGGTSTTAPQSTATSAPPERTYTVEQVVKTLKLQRKYENREPNETYAHCYRRNLATEDQMGYSPKEARDYCMELADEWLDADNCHIGEIDIEPGDVKTDVEVLNTGIANPSGTAALLAVSGGYNNEPPSDHYCVTKYQKSMANLP